MQTTLTNKHRLLQEFILDLNHGDIFSY